MIWLGVAKGVTTIQSTYASLAGEAYENYWNMYYNVGEMSVISYES